MDMTISTYAGDTPDQIIEQLIVYRLVGLSAKELFELANQYTSIAEHIEPRRERAPEDYRFSLALGYAAAGLGGELFSDDDTDDHPVVIAYRGGEFDLLREAARTGLAGADEHIRSLAWNHDVPDIMPATPVIDTERLAAKRLHITVGQYRNRVDPYSETCPRCGEALMGVFISHKNRWACCDACQVMLDAGSISTLPDGEEPSALPPYHVLSDEEIFGAGFEDWFEAEKAKPETEAPRPLHTIGEHEIPY